MRADEYLFKSGSFDSRTRAKRAILDGLVYFDGKKIEKPSVEIVGDIHEVVISEKEKYVSLGGYKLEKALTDFSFDVSGKIFADLGASTGGFTDCLLQHGAKKVYAVDLNSDLLHYSLRGDKRVVPIIKNVKNLTRTDVKNIDAVTADLSFISATMVLGVIFDLLDSGGNAIILIKPQFETGKKMRFKNGVIKDEKLRKDVCFAVYGCAVDVGFNVSDMTVAPIKDGKNVEYLMLLSKGEGNSVEFEKLYKKVKI